MDSREKLNQTNLGLNYSSEIELSSLISVKVRSLFTGNTLPCDFYFPTLFENDEAIRPKGCLYVVSSTSKKIVALFLMKKSMQSTLNPKTRMNFSII